MPAISNISVLAAFMAGIVSFLSPCVLPLVPGYVSYVAGRTPMDGPADRTTATRLSTVGLSLCFVLGFSTVFIVLGASASALGRLLLSYRVELNLISGAVVILFGVFLIGLVRPGWMMREARFHADIPGGKAAPAYLLGVAFAFGWTPCIGPILGAILTIGAATSTVAEGAALLAIYSLGLGVPFLLTALFTDHLNSAAEGDAPDRLAHANRRRRDYGWHWPRHDHRTDVDLCLLASRTVSHFHAYRLRDHGKGFEK